MRVTRFIRITGCLATLASFLVGQQSDAKGKVAGKVVDSAGQPLVRAKLTLTRVDLAPGPLVRGRNGLFSPQEDPDTPTARSGKDGEFTLTIPDAGRYSLVAEVAGYVRQTYGAKLGSSEGTVLNLDAGQSLAGIRVEMIANGRISGRVVDENGEPHRALIFVGRKTSRSGQPVFVLAGNGDAYPAGEFTVADLAPGEYYLFAAPADLSRDATTRETYITTYYGNIQNLSEAVPIELFPGSTLTGLEVRLIKAPVVSVRGRLTGKDLPQTVRLHERNTLWDWRGPVGQVAEDGSFEINGVLPGEYKLAAGNVKIASDFRGWQEIEVSARGENNFMLVVDPRFSLTGRFIVEDQSSQPFEPSAAESSGLAGVELRFVMDEFPFTRFTASGGVFPKLVHSSYLVDVANVPDGLYFAGLRVSEHGALANKIDLTSGPPGEAPLVVFRRSPGALSGVVQSDKSEPHPGAIVTVVPEPQQPNHTYLYRRVTTDQNGHFTIQNLSPGGYRIYAWDGLEPGAESDAEFTQKYRTKGTAVSVEANSSQTVTLTLIVNDR